MTKITLDRDTFKALASDTRLEILRVLDGKKMSLNDLMRLTMLNKATLHEHLSKLNDAGLISRQERDGHKWVYYKLTWKGESLLHPENTRIVVLFSLTFVALWVGIIQLVSYVKGTVMNFGYNVYTMGEQTWLADAASERMLTAAPDGASVGGLPSQLQQILGFVKGQTSGNPSQNIAIPLHQKLFAIEADAPLDTTLPPHTQYVVDQSQGMLHAVYQDPLFLYLALACFILFSVVLCIGVWRLWENRIVKL